MSLTASVPRSWRDASVQRRAVMWPTGTQGHNGLVLCDTAAYRNGCSRSPSCHFSDFGRKNHKYVPPALVRAKYARTTRVYTPSDFPAPPATSSAKRTARIVDTIARPDVVDRARRYLAALPPAVAGQHGDVETFRACCRLVRGFLLTDADALALIREWNARCDPPWTDRELADKVRRARRYGREPLGGLLEARNA